MTVDDCPPNGIERPNTDHILKDDTPFVFWNVEVFRQNPGYIRVITYLSPDRLHVQTEVQTGSTMAGPWRDLTRQL